MILRKSNSAPSLLTLAEGAEDDCDAISVCFTSEVEGPAAGGCREVVAESITRGHGSMGSETVPLYFSSLRHVDSMELMARHAVEHSSQVIPDSTFLRRDLLTVIFTAHSESDSCAACSGRKSAGLRLDKARTVLRAAARGQLRAYCSFPGANDSWAMPLFSMPHSRLCLSHVFTHTKISGALRGRRHRSRSWRSFRLRGKCKCELAPPCCSGLMLFGLRMLASADHWPNSTDHWPLTASWLHDKRATIPAEAWACLNHACKVLKLGNQQLPSSRQNGLGSDPFQEALDGIRHGHGTDRSQRF